MTERRFFYDFKDDFRDGREVEVEILYWYTVDGTPKAVVTVVEETSGFPKYGEILRVGLNRNFTSTGE